MSQKRTRNFKETFCSKCSKANKGLIKTGGDYCKDKSAKIRGGQCTGFGITETEPKKVVE